METTEVKVKLGDKELLIQTGKLAKQANASVTVRYGDTMVLVTTTASREAREDIDYFPLTVDFEEKLYAAGKIPGGFIKREGRPSDHAIVSARQIDRPIRPLFPKGFRNSVQIIAVALSSDLVNPLDVLGITGASAALSISDIPFDGPIAGVRVGRVDGKFVINPTYAQVNEGDLSLVVAGSADAITMVEGEAKFVSEQDMVDALEFAHGHIKELVKAQETLIQKLGRPKMAYNVKQPPEELLKKVEAFASARMADAVDNKTKEERENLIYAIMKESVELCKEEYPDSGNAIRDIVSDIEKKFVRKNIKEKSVRPDGRGLKEIRPITCEVNILPRTHGTGLFTRGQTQVLSILTLGTMKEEQRIDGLTDEANKRYMHQYNFPPFSVGEVRMMRGPSRRDIGHGALAERALEPVLPEEDTFPYTIRVVSEVLESNGSSSMASVCASTLALMDAGVPIKAAVAGIAMGLVCEDNQYFILSDIQGVEDHVGDMDFKIAGTSEGITAVQMDIKVKGVTREVMERALAQAKEGRTHILGKMNALMDKPRTELNPNAPRVIIMKIDVEKIGAVIGPGGKIIRRIVEETGAKIDIEEDGRVFIYANEAEAAKGAQDRIRALTAEVEAGQEYDGTVTRLMNFGAFVELLPGKEGLVHISQISNKRVAKVEDELKVGQKVHVRVREIDELGRINLTMKNLKNVD